MSSKPLTSVDGQVRNQQNLSGRRLAVVALPTTRWRQIREHAADIIAAVESIQRGEYRELTW